MYTRFHCDEMRMECFTQVDIMCLELWKQQRCKHHLTSHYGYFVLVITIILLHCLIKSHRAPLLRLAGNVNTTKWHPFSARRIFGLMQYTSKSHDILCIWNSRGCAFTYFIGKLLSIYTYDGCGEIFQLDYHPFTKVIWYMVLFPF